ncbi:MAG: hypothetical protein JKY90_05520 [Gammaproteobacteria bacterium]|nr:hypothetical protein [Gammaproteobacteria bacterium]
MITSILVLLQEDIAVFSVAVAFGIKAQLAGKGCSLGKRCNAEAKCHSNARRVGLSTPMVTLHLLQREHEPRLAMNVDRPTEHGNILLKEH